MFSVEKLNVMLLMNFMFVCDNVKYLPFNIFENDSL